MKARIPVKLSSYEKKMAQRVIKEVETQTQIEQDRAIFRTIKIACLILNEEFGFGAERIARFMAQVCEKGNLAVKNPEGWYHVDEKLKKLGVEFEDEDIEERVRHSQAFYHERGRKYREY